MPSIFKYGDIPNITFTPDKELNNLIYRSCFPTSSHTGVIHFKNGPVFWPTLYFVTHLIYNFLNDLREDLRNTDLSTVSVGKHLKTLLFSASWSCGAFVTVLFLCVVYNCSYYLLTYLLTRYYKNILVFFSGHSVFMQRLTRKRIVIANVISHY